MNGQCTRPSDETLDSGADARFPDAAPTDAGASLDALAVPDATPSQDATSSPDVAVVDDAWQALDAGEADAPPPPDAFLPLDAAVMDLDAPTSTTVDAEAPLDAAVELDSFSVPDAASAADAVASADAVILADAAAAVDAWLAPDAASSPDAASTPDCETGPGLCLEYTETDPREVDGWFVQAIWTRPGGTLLTTPWTRASCIGGLSRPSAGVTLCLVTVPEPGEPVLGGTLFYAYPVWDTFEAVCAETGGAAGACPGYPSAFSFFLDGVPLTPDGRDRRPDTPHGWRMVVRLVLP